MWFVAFYAAKVVITAFFVSPMRKLPGPWYTNLTGVERKYYAWRGLEHHYFLRMFAKHGPLVRVGPDKVGVGEVAMFRKMMGSYDLPKAQMYENFAIVGENIFTTRNTEFNKIRRRQIGPAFTAGYVRQMAPLLQTDGLDEVCRLFDAQIAAAEKQQQPGAVGKARGTTNTYYAFTMMATDIISSLAYGRRFGASDMLVRNVEAPPPPPPLSQEQTAQKEKPQEPAPQSEGYEDGETGQSVLESMIATMILMRLVAEIPLIHRVPRWILPSQLKMLYGVRDKFLAFSTRTATRYRERLTKGSEKSQAAAGARNDILSAYILAHDPETGATMSDQDVGSENTVLLAAGTDTTSNVMVSVVRYLLWNPHMMARVQRELRDVLPEREQVLTDPTAAPYLAAVIHETMRLRASTSGVWPRDAPRHAGITLGGYFIPPGTVLCGSIGGVHLNPETWERPEEFDPERFLGPEGEARKKNLVVFSAGVRICPGRHLAMLELTMVLSAVLRRYEFAPIDPPPAAADYFTDVDEICSITTGFRNPDRDCLVYVSRSD
ncbi:hypothetical protein IWQ57_002361 [Coemansia nantahalensis]|uniref:Uncharacterized protein n=1 Tax=Coemansia nantahalensis TaxID=2789366 RepID=A0ACC1K0Z2_9FUNG|nr:hypothetical protein IWQ57_002361 [Coemansia nantahalensis]